MQFQKSADTKIIESVLAEAVIGQTITYETMSKAIGRDVREFAWHSVTTARNTLLQEKSFVFAVEKNVGLVRLNDVQIVEASEFDRKKLKRVANKAIRKLGTIKYAELPEDKKREHTIASAQLGAIAMFAGKSATKRISEKVNAGKETLAIGETLAMFS